MKKKFQKGKSQADTVDNWSNFVFLTLLGFSLIGRRIKIKYQKSDLKNANQKSKI